MKMVSFVALCVVALAVVTLSGEIFSAEAVTCDPMQLNACIPAFSSGATPTATCCGKLKQQQPCFCTYIKNPALKQYVNSPNAKKVASTCGVPFPKC
ncbi:Non-specific lipid-transfer protein 2 [Hibiscus syriacus]|uniref:Non-specific lipid-transfer protein 2 n=1 Tax=Hibiscus syriacus TaxID=106335 RepID=A0A6A2X1V6_HIBSY|nr:non-specific lipid-transfer protein 2-like [Hibiscus syriacus]KAE8662390.1 Non-specific lipid-transfer protein 2 [Hibiscus syriacus]